MTNATTTTAATINLPGFGPAVRTITAPERFHSGAAARIAGDIARAEAAGDFDGAALRSRELRRHERALVGLLEESYRDARRRYGAEDHHGPVQAIAP